MRKFLLVLVVLAVALVIVIATRPPRYHVERSASIAAPAAVVAGQIDDFHHWDEWSPWAKLDPNMKVDYAGPASGVGAQYHWVGNDKVGEGRMTITDVQPAQRTVLKLDFVKPFASTSTATFTYTPEAGGTRVTWAMDGDHTFISKAMCMVMSMDRMIGPDFERGLASLRRVSEADTTRSAANVR